jgi:hypothetical protein
MKSPRLRNLKRDGKLQVIRVDDSNALDPNSMFCQEKFYWLHRSTDLLNPSKWRRTFAIVGEVWGLGGFLYNSQFSIERIFIFETNTASEPTMGLN